jgi:hypothetical protein
MTGPSTPSPERSPSQPRTLPERTLRHLDRLLVLAIVPLATALGNVGKLLATARADGLSVTASFPVYRYDLWSFVNAPDGGGAPAPIPFETLGSVWLIAPLLAIYVVVSGVLSAGYFGSIAAAITTGSFDFVASVRRFALRMIALEALVIVGLLVVFLPLLVVPPLFVIAILALLLAGYFLFPTVYVLVLEDRGIEAAARRAYALVADQRPLSFFASIVVATLVCSIPLSYLAYSGLGGAVVAAIVTAPLGLAFNVGTALKVADMAGIQTVR